MMIRKSSWLQKENKKSRENNLKITKKVEKYLQNKEKGPKKQKNGRCKTTHKDAQNKVKK